METDGGTKRATTQEGNGNKRRPSREVDDRGMSATPTDHTRSQSRLSLDPVVEMIPDAEPKTNEQMVIPAMTSTGQARTPPRSRARSAMPDGPLSPMPGCATEELRNYTAKMFSKMEASISEIINRQSLQGVKITKLERGNDLKNDVDAMKKQLGNINTKQNDPVVDVDMRAMAGRLEQGLAEAQAMIEKVSRDTSMAEHKLRTELSTYSVIATQSSENLQAFEAAYKNHIENNFNVVEKEFNELRQGMLQTHAAVTTAGAENPRVEATVNVLEFNIHKNKLENNDKLILDVSARLRRVEERCHFYTWTGSSTTSPR